MRAGSALRLNPAGIGPRSVRLNAYRFMLYVIVSLVRAPALTAQPPRGRGRGGKKSAARGSWGNLHEIPTATVVAILCSALTTGERELGAAGSAPALVSGSAHGVSTTLRFNVFSSGFGVVAATTTAGWRREEWPCTCAIGSFAFTLAFAAARGRRGRRGLCLRTQKWLPRLFSFSTSGWTAFFPLSQCRDRKRQRGHGG